MVTLIDVNVVKKNISENKDVVSFTFLLILKVIKFMIELVIQLKFELFRERILNEKKKYRNFYYERSLLTPFGLIQNIKIPRLRNFQFRTEFFQSHQRRIKNIDKLIVAFHTLGHGYREIQKMVRLMWNEPSMSLSTISRITDLFIVEVKDIFNGDIKMSYSIFWFDGIYFPVKGINKEG